MSEPERTGDAVALTVDALGRRCPVPVIELARRIGQVAVGEVVAVLADDEAARLDVPAWCEMRGHTYLGECRDPRGPTYLVRRLH
ncbi:MAG: sulfurtransferase TusA family protein [Actinomycetes bacterium]